MVLLVLRHEECGVGCGVGLLVCRSGGGTEM